MTDKCTYTKYVPDSLVREVGTDAAILAARLYSFMENSEDGIARVTMPTLCAFFGWSVDILRRHLRTLVQRGIITRNVQYGRGAAAEYQKGSNFTTFFDIKKGSKSAREKVAKLPPLNKRLNKKYNNIGAPACASTPTTIIKNLEIMKEFEEFWNAYQPTAEFQHERDRCERVWLYMSELLRADIIKSVKRQKPTKSPYCYLRYYKSQDLRLMPSGSRVEYDRYYKFYSTTENRDGWTLMVVKDVRGNDKAIYIKQ